MAGLGISLVIFFIIRAFAREPPRTMTKQWQEATNEYLKVSFRQALPQINTENFVAESELRAHYRNFVGGLRGQGTCAEQVEWR